MIPAKTLGFYRDENGKNIRMIALTDGDHVVKNIDLHEAVALIETLSKLVKEDLQCQPISKSS